MRNNIDKNKTSVNINRKKNINN